MAFPIWICYEVTHFHALYIEYGIYSLIRSSEPGNEVMHEPVFAILRGEFNHYILFGR